MKSKIKKKVLSVFNVFFCLRNLVGGGYCYFFFLKSGPFEKKGKPCFKGLTLFLDTQMYKIKSSNLNNLLYWKQIKYITSQLKYKLLSK